jgi:hypothetical protein
LVAFQEKHQQRRYFSPKINKNSLMFLHPRNNKINRLIKKKKKKERKKNRRTNIQVNIKKEQLLEESVPLRKLNEVY